MQQHRRDRRGRVIVLTSIVAAALAIVVGVTVVFLGSIRPETAGPQNMASDGILIGQGLAATRTQALQPGETPEPSTVPSASPSAEAGDEAATETAVPASPVAIRLYVDFQCEECGEFLDENRQQIETWLDRGAATVEFHPVAIRSQQGTQYSARAANAAACVADTAPDAFWGFASDLLIAQPEDATGYDDDALVERATAAGATGAGVETCIRDREFRSWVTDATQRAVDGPLPGTDIDGVSETPTVLVEGAQYLGSLDAAEFANFVQQAAAERYADETAVTPSPSPAA